MEQKTILLVIGQFFPFLSGAAQKINGRPRAPYRIVPARPPGQVLFFSTSPHQREQLRQVVLFHRPFLQSYTVIPTKHPFVFSLFLCSFRNSHYSFCRSIDQFSTDLSLPARPDCSSQQPWRARTVLSISTQRYSMKVTIVFEMVCISGSGRIAL